MVSATRITAWCLWMMLTVESCAERLSTMTGSTPQERERRVLQTLSRMTLTDKIAQMAQVDINDLCEDDPNEEGKRRLSEEKVRTVIGEHGVGSVLNYIQGRPFTPKELREAVMYIQTVAKNYSRPPVIYGLDSVHGANYVHGAVISPQPINLAATFNTTVAKMAGSLAARDTRAVGINWLFSPLIGISIEPMWSRVYETFGEDPLVVGAMAQNMIEGIQLDAKDGGIPSKGAACAKHFIGYSSPHNGHDRSPSWIPTRHLYQYFVPPWITAIQDANVLTVMESYTEVDGVPNVANPSTLRYLLRQRLGFEGALVTDYEEILNLNKWHHIDNNDHNAVVHSIREGSVDISMIPHDDAKFIESVSAAIANSSLVEERINQSVERVLRLKDKVGMFKEEIVMDDPNLALIGQDQDKQHALEMAHQSIVLVKNNQNTLPLMVGQPQKILVTGPTAHSLTFQSGGWTGEWQGVPAGKESKYFTYGATVLDALQSVSPGWEVTFSCGVGILGEDCEDPQDAKASYKNSKGQGSGVLDQVNDAYGKLKDWGAGLLGSEPSNSIERAAALATASDVVVICIGEEAYTEKPGDIRSMELPKGQYELVDFVKQNTNAKVLLVYFGGRPRLLQKVVVSSIAIISPSMTKVNSYNNGGFQFVFYFVMQDFADAILLGFLPGPSGGQAVVDIISGKVNPSARLPITYPMYEDGGGSPYFHTISDQCTKAGENPLPHYDYVQCEVQWSFGFGLR
jgi:beta-glucosidase